MLTFNAILKNADLDPSSVYLLRHQDRRLPAGRLYEVWHTSRDNFEIYQKTQRWKNRFKKDHYLAAFLVGFSGETLFVGLYQIKNVERSAEPFNDPILGEMLPEDRAWHETIYSKRLCEYEERLVIDWGASPLAWRQRAHIRDKKILEIRAENKEEAFPGYSKFHRRLGSLTSVSPTWHSHLKEHRGVYLLTFEDGSQYVGSATGSEGFWQRWSDYLRSGTGGNVVLQRDNKDARDAMVSVLEVAGSAFTRQEIINQEMLWQRKLGRRAKPLEEDVATAQRVNKR